MKIVFVTGASKGIGKAIAEKYLENGYKVIGTSRKKFDTFHKNFEPLILDITDRDAISSIYEELKLKNLIPNIVINNAGITQDKLLLKMKDDDWDTVINTNLNGVFNITKIFSRDMIKNKYGRIVNISSISGLMGNPGQINYSSSKSALSGFTKSLAKELGSRNITINNVAPGFIETDMTALIKDTKKKDLLKDIPLLKFGVPRDVSNLVYFLTSDEASYITGQTISIDGGLLMS